MFLLLLWSVLGAYDFVTIDTTSPRMYMKKQSSNYHLFHSVTYLTKTITDTAQVKCSPNQWVYQAKQNSIVYLFSQCSDKKQASWHDCLEKCKDKELDLNETTRDISSHANGQSSYVQLTENVFFKDKIVLSYDSVSKINGMNYTGLVAIVGFQGPHCKDVGDANIVTLYRLYETCTQLANQEKYFKVTFKKGLMVEALCDTSDCHPKTCTSHSFKMNQGCDSRGYKSFYTLPFIFQSSVEFMGVGNYTIPGIRKQKISHFYPIYAYPIVGICIVLLAKTKKNKEH